MATSAPPARCVLAVRMRAEFIHASVGAGAHRQQQQQQQQQQPSSLPKVYGAVDVRRFLSELHVSDLRLEQVLCPSCFSTLSRFSTPSRFSTLA